MTFLKTPADPMPVFASGRSSGIVGLAIRLLERWADERRRRRQQEKLRQEIRRALGGLDNAALGDIGMVRATERFTSLRVGLDGGFHSVADFSYDPVPLDLPAPYRSQEGKRS